MNAIKFLNEIKEPKVSELGGKGYSLAGEPIYEKLK